MTLHESETKLAEINNSLAELLKERENTSMHLLNIANGCGFNVPEHQRNLVYAKAMEIREHAREAV